MGKVRARVDIEMAKTKRKPTFTDDMNAKLSELKGKVGQFRYGEIEINTQKAIVADKIFDTNGQFALDYLEAEIKLTKPPENPPSVQPEAEEEEEEEGEEQAGVAELDGDADVDMGRMVGED